MVKHRAVVQTNRKTRSSCPVGRCFRKFRAPPRDWALCSRSCRLHHLHQRPNWPSTSTH